MLTLLLKTYIKHEMLIRCLFSVLEIVKMFKTIVIISLALMAGMLYYIIYVRIIRIYIKFYNNISLIQTIVVFIDLLISIFKKCINYWKNNEKSVTWNFLVWYLSFWFLISTYQAHFLMQIKNWCLSFSLKFNFPNPFSNFVTLVVIFINMNKYFYYHWT